MDEVVDVRDWKYYCYICNTSSCNCTGTLLTRTCFWTITIARPLTVNVLLVEILTGGFLSVKKAWHQ